MKTYKKVALILIPALLLIYLILPNPYLLHLAIMVAVYMMLATSVDIIYGYAGQLNLGQAAFYAIGAYTTALLMLRLDFSYWMALPLAGIFAALFGFMLGMPTLRLRGLYLGIATLGFAEAVRLILLSWAKLTRGPMGLPGIPLPAIGSFVFSPKIPFLVLIFIYLFLTIFIFHRIVNSRAG